MISTDKIPTGPGEIRKFGILFALICAAVGGYLFWKESALWSWFGIAGAFFLVTGLFVQAVLRPVYSGWMMFAFVLGWVNTRILLGVFFYLIITPLGFVMRLAGKDLLDQKIDRQASTYWKKRERIPLDPKRIEQQF